MECTLFYPEGPRDHFLPLRQFWGGPINWEFGQIDCGEMYEFHIINVNLVPRNGDFSILLSI